MAEGADDAAFMAAMGRTRKCVHSHLRRRNDYSFGNVFKTGHYAGDKIQIPPEVLEDRNRRLMAQYLRSPAAQIMGDPIPGFSALDNRP